MVSKLSNIGTTIQMRITLDKTKVSAIENTGRDIGGCIRSYIDYLYSTISNSDAPVMETASHVKKVTMNLTEIVNDTARYYLSQDKNEDTYCKQGCIFTEGQCERIYELVRNSGENTSLESVKTILSGFKL